MTQPVSGKLIPVPGRTVPLEDGSPWPTGTKKADGREVPVHIAQEVILSRYYRRRLRDGDLVDIEVDSEAAPAKAVDPPAETGKGRTANTGKKG